MLLPLLILCLAAHQHSASALVEFVACSPAAGSMLTIGAHVWCEFVIDTDRLQVESATLDVRLSGKQEFPLLASEFNGTMRVKQLSARQLAPPHNVTQGDGKHALVVVFSYSECAVTGVTLALRIQINRDLSTEPIYFRQAHACVLASSDVTDGTQATASILIIVVLLVLVLFSLAGIFLNPRGFQ
jgi:hypothetical protein